MPRMTTEQLAGQKLEGSYARQDAIKAARRRLHSKSQMKAASPQSAEAIMADMAAKERDDFEALIAAIDAAPSRLIMKKIARAAVRKAYPHFAEEAA